MKILIKYPTRGRPQQFLKTLSEWIGAAEEPANLSVLVSYDADDATMSKEVIEKAERLHPSVVCVMGNSKTKIEACNADLNDYHADWDVAVLVSDDMIVRRQGWDDLVRKKMQEHFPDTDGCLWFHDGSKQTVISTLSVVGRMYYNRFRYLYHPAYASFFCDNEYTEVALLSGRIAKFSDVIATHEHPSWCGGMKRDRTYERNNPYWAQDQATYKRRFAAGFPRAQISS